MPPRFKPDHEGIGDLLRSPGMHDLVRDAAEYGKAYAESIAPDAPPKGQGYITRFRVESGMTEIIAKARRPVAHLVNIDPYAAAVEWEYDYHILGRTIEYIEGRS